MSSEAADPLLHLERLTRRFGTLTAVDGVELSVGEGELFCLLGPSGCGKSTLLRLIGGFEAPDEGRILLAGQDVTDVPPHRRPLNTMFQSYALFPHLSVGGNVAYGLKRAGLPRAEIAGRVAELLRLVRLDGLADRAPDRLSGGQRQRVALARALARRPRLLLLDEPLGALDRRLREETQAELKALRARLGTTFVIVTHDQDEAAAMADRIGVMEGGRLVQVGPPREVYRRPRTRFVAGFIGDANLLDATVVGTGPDGCELRLADPPARLVAAVPGARPAPGASVTLAIRPEGLEVLPALGSEPEAFEVRVEDVAFRGGLHLVRARSAGGAVLRVAAGEGDAAGPVPGGALRLRIRPGAATVLDG